MVHKTTKQPVETLPWNTAVKVFSNLVPGVLGFKACCTSWTTVKVWSRRVIEGTSDCPWPQVGCILKFQDFSVMKSRVALCRVATTSASFQEAITLRLERMRYEIAGISFWSRPFKHCYSCEKIFAGCYNLRVCKNASYKDVVAYSCLSLLVIAADSPVQSSPSRSCLWSSLEYFVPYILQVAP